MGRWGQTRTTGLSLGIAGLLACGAPDQPVNVGTDTTASAADAPATASAVRAGPPVASGGSTTASGSSEAVSATPSGSATVAAMAQPIPKCPLRSGYRPLLAAAKAVIATDEPALKPAVAQMRRAIKKWQSDHGQKMSSCKLVLNDGELISVECASFFLNGNGSAREGEDTFLNFRRQGDRILKLDDEAMLPGSPGGALPLLKKTCHWEPDPDQQVALLPTPDRVHAELGDGPLSSAHCPLEYAVSRAQVDCGPLAVLAGHAKRSAPTNKRHSPLGFVSQVHETASRLLWPVFSGVDARGTKAAQAVNAALAPTIARLNAHAQANVVAECEVTLSTVEVVAISCKGDAEPENRDGFSFRLAGPPYRITSTLR